MRMTGYWAAIAVLTSLALATPAAARPHPDSTFKVTLTRGPCFGSCPVYSVTVDARGQVTFKGDRFVACVGDRQWRIGREDVARLQAQVDASGFFGFRDAYRGHVTDLPTYQVTVTRRGRTKTVVDYVGGTVGMPAAMTTLEVTIDNVAGTIRCIDPPHPAA